MPELPEVHTTITGLQKKIIGLTIKDLWSNSFSLAYINRNTHKNKAYFKTLKEVVTGNKIMNVSRRGKHILIHLSFGDTLVVHLKMTGHLLFGNTHSKMKSKMSGLGYHKKKTHPFLTLSIAIFELCLL